MTQHQREILQKLEKTEGVDIFTISKETGLAGVCHQRCEDEAKEGSQKESGRSKIISTLPTEKALF